MVVPSPTKGRGLVVFNISAKDGEIDGAKVGEYVGFDGAEEGFVEGDFVDGAKEGFLVGLVDGLKDGLIVGFGLKVGLEDGLAVGILVGDNVLGNKPQQINELLMVLWLPLKTKLNPRNNFFVLPQSILCLSR